MTLPPNKTKWTNEEALQSLLTEIETGRGTRTSKAIGSSTRATIVQATNEDVNGADIQERIPMRVTVDWSRHGDQS